VSSTDYLLEHITSLIRDSAGCIFDATGGNPNVSLEVGIAHAMPANFLLTFYTRKPRTRPEQAANKAEKALEGEGELKPIISDLQGKPRIEYKTYERLKEQLVKRYLTKLPYMKRWEEFRKRNSSYVQPALATFQEIRTSGRTMRSRVAANLEGTGIHVDDLLGALSSAKLLSVRRGRTGGLYYPSVS